MAEGYLAQVQALIDQKMKENPEEMKRRLKEIEEAKKAPKAPKEPTAPPKPLIDPQLTQELIEELNKGSGADMQVVKDLIKRGADIKAKDKWEDTVLHQASYFGELELAKECLQAGIDVNAKNKWGATPLHYAVDGNKIEIAKFLITSGADVGAKDKWDTTPLVLVKSEEMKALLRKHGAK